MWAPCDTSDLAQSYLLAVFSVVGKETIAFFHKLPHSTRLRACGS